MDQPQPCTKCKKLPEDILMLACSHDLCLDCAAERLAFQLKKKKPANSIVCEICYERTALDAESIAELEKLIPAKNSASKTYAQPRQPYERVERVERTGPRIKAYDVGGSERVEKPREYNYSGNAGGSNSLLLSGVSNKKNCVQHADEQILYFCFDCKCECICPQCIIHDSGKHKDHDVKTIKKAAPVVRGELEKTVDKVESSIENLLIRKSEVEKNIRSLSEQNSQTKRQVQSAFEEVRGKLALKEKEILSRLDGQFNESVEQLQKSIKTLLKKIEDLKSYSSTTTEVMKREDMLILNFYAKRWKQISEESKDVSVVIPNVSAGGNDKILSSILQLTDHVDRIAVAQRKR